MPLLRQAVDRLLSLTPQAKLPPPPQQMTTGAARTSAQEMPMLPKSETLGLIAAAATRHNVPAVFIQSIVAAESNFDCTVVSPKGAIGLMQLMPETAEQFGADPTVPAQNIDAGTRYLRWLMDRYRNSKKHVAAAYNAGPAMVDRYHGIPPFKETRTYVSRVMNYLRQFEGSRKGGPKKG
jgi:soluble lytic murein transglycosylase-like protein